MKPAIALLLAVCLFAQPPQTAVRGQQFVDLLVAGNFSAAEAVFDSTMKSKLPESSLRAAWQSVLSQAGPFQKQLGTKVAKVQGYDVANVKCEFQQGTLTVRVVFDQAQHVAGLFFLPPESSSAAAYQPPSYVNQASFKDKEVLFGTQDWMVHGTVTIPAGVGPFPAVVLVHGSGPNDRDETVGPNKPFRDLAWGLASSRIAVLRYEKRTREHGAKWAAAGKDFTVKEESVDDTLSAVQVLRSTERVDPNRIFVLGHSLGATLAPWIGKADSRIAGLIILAGITRPFEDVIVDQYTYLASLGQASSKDLAKIQAQAARVKDPQLSSDTPKESLPFSVPAPYWLALRSYNPAEVARGLAQPMLILQGERDYQVTMQDLDGWKKALSARRNVTIKSYPDLNHLFMEGAGKSRPEEYQKAGHVSRQVITDIAAWIGERK